MDAVKEFVEFVMNNGPQIVAGASAIIGGFTAIARITPNKVDNKIAKIAMKIVDFFAIHADKTDTSE